MATGTRAFLRRFSSSAEHRRFRDAKPKNSPDDPRAPCKERAQIRRAPPVSRREDKIGKEKGLSCQGFRTPLCAGIRCGCGAAAGRKASPKPEGFWRGRIGNIASQRKRTARGCSSFVCTANLRFAHAFFSAAIRRAAVLLRKTEKRTSGIQNPALRRDTVRLRHCGRVQSMSKSPKAFGGVRIGNIASQRKRTARGCSSFVCTANLSVRYAFPFAAERRAAISLCETRKRTSLKLHRQKQKAHRSVCFCFWCTFRDSNPGPTD